MKVSVIGCGNLGSAVVKGLLTEGYDVVACDKDPDALAALPEGGGVEKTESPQEATQKGDVVVLAVKPKVAGPVLDSFELDDGQVLASFAAAVSLDFLGGKTKEGAKVVRVMPNLAAEYNEMAAAVSPPGEVPESVQRILGDLGSYVEIDEGLMDIATAVNGSGPAFVFYAMKAMKEAGVEGGLEEDAAETLTAQTFRGAATIIQNDERTLDELIDAVCSPGGTTIEGMEVLREADAGRPFADAVAAAERRSEEITEELDL
jgi:pyrroline-5-carboxylate reductase